MDHRMRFMLFILLQAVTFSSTEKGMKLETSFNPYLISPRIQKDHLNNSNDLR